MGQQILPNPLTALELTALPLCFPWCPDGHRPGTRTRTTGVVRLSVLSKRDRSGSSRHHRPRRPCREFDSAGSSRIRLLLCDSGVKVQGRGAPGGASCPANPLWTRVSKDRPPAPRIAFALLRPSTGQIKQSSSWWSWAPTPAPPPRLDLAGMVRSSTRNRPPVIVSRGHFQAVGMMCQKRCNEKFSTGQAPSGPLVVRIPNARRFCRTELASVLSDRRVQRDCRSHDQATFSTSIEMNLDVGFLPEASDLFELVELYRTHGTGKATASSHEARRRRSREKSL